MAEVRTGPTVVVTGAGGLIGRRLLSALVAHPDVGRVVATDLPGAVPPGHRREIRPADVRDRAQLAAAFAGADVVVHLAYQLDPLHDEDRMRAVNVDGSRNVAEVAAAAGVQQLVVASSATAYGAHPDNPVPLTEDQPLRANPTFAYAAHKAEVERDLAVWHRRHPEVELTVLRPAIVAGPGVDNFISRQLDAPRFPTVAGHAPPMQFVHLDDVTRAFAHVVTERVAGTFNVAPPGWLSLDEVTAIIGRRRLELPEEVAHSLAQALWAARLAPAPPGQLPYVMHPWIVAVDRLLATGWKPQHTNRDALASLAAEHADRIALGAWTTSRTGLRLTAGLAGTAALGAAARAWRRRRG